MIMSEYFINIHFSFRQRNFQTVSLTKIQEFIDMGRLKVKEGEMITMRDLYMAGVATGIDDGIKLLAGVRGALM